MLRRCVQNIRIVWREYNRKGPLPSFLQSACRHAGKEQWIYLDVTSMTCRTIEASQQSALAAGIKKVRIPRMRSNVAALAAADRVHHVRCASTATPCFARNTNG